MLVNGDRGSSQCPIAGQFEDRGLNMQCPMESYWTGPPNNVCDGVYSSNYVDSSMQCYNYPVNVKSVPQYYPQPHQPPVRYIPPQPIIPNLPCHQVQQWDYNSMCFDVDGQPCQYTGIVDLEDFM